MHIDVSQAAPNTIEKIHIVFAVQKVVNPNHSYRILDGGEQVQKSSQARWEKELLSTAV